MDFTVRDTEHFSPEVGGKPKNQPFQWQVNLGGGSAARAACGIEDNPSCRSILRK